MVSEERTNKNSIISVATTSVAADDSDTGSVTLPPLPSAPQQYKGLERQRKYNMRNHTTIVRIKGEKVSFQYMSH